MGKVVIVGGGWAGCAAAVGAAKAGMKVTLLERTDMILGTGLVGGIMRNNGRYTATEEMIAMGGGDLFHICDETARHKNINFPGHEHASLYDIVKTPIEVMNYLIKLGVEIRTETRITNVIMNYSTLIAVVDKSGNKYYGDVFIDATGTAGPTSNCVRYGNGCAMCILRCPTFGGRVSLIELTGVKEFIGRKADGSYGAMSGSCKIYKESLDENIQEELNKKGVAIIPIPEELREEHLDVKACQQYALKEFKENVILLDTGHAKLMAPFYPIDRLRKIPGFHKVRYEDPYSASKGNSIRLFSIAPRDNSLKVAGVDNLYCAGEKVGLLVGHTEAIITGILAGHNSARYLFGISPLEISSQLATGDLIAYINNSIKEEDGLRKKYTFSGSVYFERMLKLGLYTVDIEKIKEKVKSLDLNNIFERKLTIR